ncbi:hypothetical protein Pmani_002131 [Petrolisthes manimaculis]|uniref:Reverse transcriptase Ty1/copia-type domain-containing protein n=1 Tax=Petrolisthes manimaculis TaxID=1843537 RepID=A0AAE1UKS4_9EUCA|nr:hypothetical protein Pmani_002131 [Petrolisthes manimaculis]
MSCPGGKSMPPVFGGDKGYERWKTELEAWQLVTNVEKKKQAITVALSFPEGSEVRDRVFNEIEITVLNADDGMKALLQQMDTWYKKDKLASAYDSWSDFDSFRKTDDLTMESYITQFEKRHKKLSKHNIVLPESILAFKLLDCAGLSHRDKQLALTAVDYNTPDTIFKQMSQALKKFFGVKAVPSSSTELNSGASSGITIKKEPVYVAEDVNFTGQGQSWRNEGDSTQPSGSRLGPNRGNRTGRGSQRKNPQDFRGNVTKCHICRSEFHYANKCPKRERKVYEIQAESNFEGNGCDEVYLTCGKRTLEGTTMSETLAKHLNAMHAGRRAFIMAETSEKLRRAIRHQVSQNMEIGANEKKKDETVSGESNTQNNFPVRVTGNIPKVGQRVRYLAADSNDWTKATILSHAGKVTGKYKTWLNIQDDGCDPKSIDWITGVKQWEYEPQDHISDTSLSECNEVFLSVSRQYDKDVLAAKQAELENWKKFKVFEEVSDRGQPSMSVRWVCTEKDVDGETKVNARLVARGFEESHHDRTDSPTGGKEILRVFLSILACKNWKCNSIDIKAAFLQGENFQRDVYLKPPPEAENVDKVLWKLNKCVYGLNDASRVWYFTVRTFLLKLGCVQLKADPAGFYWYNEGILSGVLLMHVDDFIWGGTRAFENKVVAKIRSEFQVGQQCSGAFKYIGLQVTQDDDGITISQSQYLKNVKPVPINITRACNKLEDCNKTEQENLRSLVGQIGWMSTNTRPDVSYDVLNMSCVLNHPKVENVIQANKCLRRLEIVDSCLRFPHLGDLSNVKLIVFSDASHASLPDGYSSAGGFIIFLVGENGKSCPFAWEAKKIRRVVKSTLAAETLAASDAVDMCYFLGTVLSEILFHVNDKNVIPICSYVDNHSLVENVHSTKNVSEKRLRIDLAALKELVQEGHVMLKWVKSNVQLADCLTKKGVNTQNLLHVVQKGELCM